ncbi:MAG: hypothetical protein HY075_14630 [Deltaproteobacteria bacterium]|nr:hypothetical protein [Deltaproteobacteria bacterium]
MGPETGSSIARLLLVCASAWGLCGNVKPAYAHPPLLVKIPSMSPKTDPKNPMVVSCEKQATLKVTVTADHAADKTNCACPTCSSSKEGIKETGSGAAYLNYMFGGGGALALKTPFDCGGDKGYVGVADVTIKCDKDCKAYAESDGSAPLGAKGTAGVSSDVKLPVDFTNDLFVFNVTGVVVGCAHNSCTVKTKSQHASVDCYPPIPAAPVSSLRDTKAWVKCVKGK